MEDIKSNISNNLVLLRKTKKITQKELAKHLNYSDKAISRWEKGDSLPDIDLLIKVAEFYGVSFEWLLHTHEQDDIKSIKKHNNKNMSIKIAVVALLIISCLGLATLIFVYSNIVYKNSIWQIFIWGAQVSLLFASFYCYKWWSRLIGLISLSASMWTFLLCIFVSMPYLSNIWLIFLLGIPVQSIFILLYIIRKDKSNKDE